MTEMVSNIHHRNFIKVLLGLVKFEKTDNKRIIEYLSIIMEMEDCEPIKTLIEKCKSGVLNKDIFAVEKEIRGFFFAYQFKATKKQYDNLRRSIWFFLKNERDTAFVEEFIKSNNQNDNSKIEHPNLIGKTNHKFKLTETLYPYVAELKDDEEEPFIVYFAARDQSHAEQMIKNKFSNLTLVNIYFS